MKTTLSNFTFYPSGHGRYFVTFTSFKTQRKWAKTITDMEVIDATKNTDEPKQKDLNQLKKMIKR
jgi:hypothetical protein